MSNDNQSVEVVVKSDTRGHWVTWDNAGEPGVLGPYEDLAMAEHVRDAKEREFTQNLGHIDDA